MIIRRSDQKRMFELADAFPTLRGVLERWDDEAPQILDSWACGPTVTDRGLAAARFVLGVYSYDAQWRCGIFSMGDITRWDDEHIAAFASWARDPFWP